MRLRMDKKLKIKKADPGISPIGLVGGPPFPKVHKATVVNRRRRKMKLGGTVSLKIRIAARSPKSSVRTYKKVNKGGFDEQGLKWGRS